MNNTLLHGDSLSLCPQLSSSDCDSAASRCWTCSVFCCCFPLCYPCYLSRTLRKRKKMGKKHAGQKSRTWLRNESGQEAYRRSKPIATGQSRVTSTMSSEETTGISGSGTLLSRKCTLQSLNPNMKPIQFQEGFLEKVDSSRRDINAVFISSDAATKFLTACQLSELFQEVTISDNQNQDIEEIFDEVTKTEEITCKDSTSLKSHLSSNSSYTFSHSCLQFVEDSQLNLPSRRKRSSMSLNNNGGNFFPFDNDLEAIPEEEHQVFKSFGHVDVSEPKFSAKVLVTAETEPKSLLCVDPMLLARAYSNLLPLADLIVIFVGQEFRSVPMQGLIEYISKYWAGFFPAVLVQVGMKEEGDRLLDTFSEVFCNVERVTVLDTKECGGQVFSAVARTFSTMGCGGFKH